MKPAGVVEAYTTKISYCLLLLKISENSMAIEKTYFSESRKSLSRQLLFQVFLYLGFILFLHFIIQTAAIINILWSKQASL